MKKSIFILSLISLIAINGYSQIENANNQPYVQVSASADTLVVPDEIYINIQISESDNKKLSVEEQETKMIQAFQSISIPVEKDLSTSDMLSNYRVRILKSNDIVKTKKYQLKVHDASTASKVFVALENIGISNSSIDRVDYSDKYNLRNVCRSIAIVKAKQIAETLVRPLNQQIGKAIQITDVAENIYTSSLQGQLNDVVVAGYISGKAQGVTPNLDFQKVKISVTENVKFILQ